MPNILDYLDWRGDIGFEASPFNEVDSLILSELSYVDFKDYVGSDFSTPITLKEAGEKLISDEGKAVFSMLFLDTKEFTELLQKASASRRFGGIKLLNFVNNIDTDREMQFSAITYELYGDLIYIAFRGTDDTVVGWKEDLNMGVLETIPSQPSALAYLIHTATRFSNRKIILGGHSKGGNLAIYSAINSHSSIHSRIEHIYNHDGPGFLNGISNNDAFSKLEPRITTLIPQGSIVGMLLEHDEKYSIVESNKSGLLQHNGFSWEVMGTEFRKKPVTETNSQIVDMTLKQYLAKSSLEERQRFVNGAAEIIAGFEQETLSDITADKIRNMIKVAKNMENISPEGKKAMTEALKFISKELLSAIRDVRHRQNEEKALRSKEQPAGRKNLQEDRRHS